MTTIVVGKVTTTDTLYAVAVPRLSTTTRYVDGVPGTIADDGGSKRTRISGVATMLGGTTWTFAFNATEWGPPSFSSE